MAPIDFAADLPWVMADCGVPFSYGTPARTGHGVLDQKEAAYGDAPTEVVGTVSLFRAPTAQIGAVTQESTISVGGVQYVVADHYVEEDGAVTVVQLGDY